MSKTPEEKLAKAATKATATVRMMLERALQAYEVFDEAVASGRLHDAALAQAQDGLAAMRACLVRLGELLTELETAPEPSKQASIFVANQTIGDEMAAAMERVSAVDLPPAPERATQQLVLKAKKGEWAEVRVPLDPEDLAEALTSADWRGKALRAIAGTRERLEHVKDPAAAKGLGDALDRIEQAIAAEENAEAARQKTNALEAALNIRRKWQQLGFFKQMTQYLAADAESLGVASRGVEALAKIPDGAEGHAKASELLESWRKRHKDQRKAVRFALLGDVYDFTAYQEALDGEADYAQRVAAVLQAEAEKA